MAQNKITSITLPRVQRFLSSASIDETITCDKVTGFEVVKTAKGASYRLRYTAPNGRRRRKVIAKVSEMKPAEAAEIALNWKGEDDPLEKDKQRKQAYIKAQELSAQRTLGNYLNGLYTKHQERKRSGRETLNMIRKNFDHLSDRDMALISVSDIKQWQIKREQDGIKFPTIQRAYGALKTLLNKAVSDGFLESNPLPRETPLERPHFEEIDKQLEGQGKRRLLSSNELLGLFNGIEAYNSELKRQRAHSIQRGRKYLESFDGKRFAHWSIPFAYIAYFTGMRVGDIKALTWQNLNLNFKRLSFIPSKTRHHPDPISVTLDLPNDIIDLMKQWHREIGEPSGGLVFPTKTGRPLDKKSHIAHWEKIRKLGSLPEDLDFYSLRHHWISTLVQTENLLQVARMSGHKSTKMIEKHYGHLIPDRAKGALQAFRLPTQQQGQILKGE